MTLLKFALILFLVFAAYEIDRVVTLVERNEAKFLQALDDFHAVRQQLPKTTDAIEKLTPFRGMYR